MSGQVLMGSKSEEKLSGPDLMEIAKDSVVRISSKLGEYGGHGTAFAYKQVMTETGSTVYFLTNLHNFSGALQLRNTVFARASQGHPDDELFVKTIVILKRRYGTEERIFKMILRNLMIFPLVSLLYGILYLGYVIFFYFYGVTSQDPFILIVFINSQPFIDAVIFGWNPTFNEELRKFCQKRRKNGVDEVEM